MEKIQVTIICQPCMVDIQKDLPKSNEPQPLYIIPDKDRFWLPNSQGHLEIPHGSSIELYCTKGYANATEEGGARKIPKNTRTLKPICLQANTFLLGGEKYEFRQFICAQQPKYSVERTGEKCAADGKGQLYRVGYNITQGRFMETMKICHDDATLRTHYTQHTLLPANLHFQKSVKRLNFSKAGYFKDVNMNYLYTQNNQRQQAVTLLTGSNSALFDKKTYLSRGHLAAKSDLIYANQQRSSFNFFNAAPQWQSFNGGQWSALEDEVRKFVAKSQLEVDCYTGTWGILEFPSKNGLRYPFYLANDENNNGLLPVPQLFFRVLVNRKQPTRGIVLVGVNNPHATMREIVESYVICDDIREQVPWLRWIRNKSLKKGFLYACAVNDFARAVRNMPAHLISVNEVLMGS